MSQKVTLKIDSLGIPCNDHENGEQLAMLLIKFPAHFCEGKISFTTKKQNSYQQFLDSLFALLDRLYPNFVFDRFEVQGFQGCKLTMLSKEFLRRKIKKLVVSQS